MNSSAAKSLRNNVCELPTGQSKKPRRHRNRYKNFNLKKKKIKKFMSTNKAGTLRSKIFKFKRSSEKIMTDWYWSNYRKALEWRNTHKVAYWKAYALALFEENRYLLEIVNHMQLGIFAGGSAASKAGDRGMNFNIKHMGMKYSGYFPGHFPVQNDVDEDDSHNNHEENDTESSSESNLAMTEEGEDDIEFEMSDEMMQFFEQSYKHRVDRKKLKEKEVLNNTEQEIQQIQNNKIKRSTEMNFLYGEGASMIIGMETAVQLSFDKYCDLKSPKYWPNIPFRL